MFHQGKDVRTLAGYMTDTGRPYINVNFLYNVHYKLLLHLSHFNFDLDASFDGQQTPGLTGCSRLAFGTLRRTSQLYARCCCSSLYILPIPLRPITLAKD